MQTLEDLTVKAATHWWKKASFEDRMFLQWDKLPIPEQEACIKAVGGRELLSPEDNIELTAKQIYMSLAYAGVIGDGWRRPDHWMHLDAEDKEPYIELAQQLAAKE